MSVFVVYEDGSSGWRADIEPPVNPLGCRKEGDDFTVYNISSGLTVFKTKCAEAARIMSDPKIFAVASVLAIPA